MNKKFLQRAVSLCMTLALLLVFGLGTVSASTVQYDYDTGDFNEDGAISGTDINRELSIGVTLKTPSGTVLPDPATPITLTFDFGFNGYATSSAQLVWGAGVDFSTDPFSMKYIDWTSTIAGRLTGEGTDPLGLSAAMAGKTLTLDSNTLKTADGMTSIGGASATYIDEYYVSTGDLLAGALTSLDATATIDNLNPAGITTAGYYFYSVRLSNNNTSNYDIATDFKSLETNNTWFVMLISVENDNGTFKVAHVGYAQVSGADGVLYASGDIKKVPKIDLPATYMALIPDSLITGQTYDYNDLSTSNNMWFGLQTSGSMANSDQGFNLNIGIGHPAITTAAYDTMFAAGYPAFILVNDNNTWRLLTQSDMSDTDATAKFGTTVLDDGAGNLYIPFSALVASVVNMYEDYIFVVRNPAYGTYFNAAHNTGLANSYDTLGYTITTNANYGTPTMAVYGSTANGQDTNVQTLGGGITPYAGNGGNAIVYTATLDGTVLTGVTVENVPFFALLVLAVGSVAVLLVVKTRKARKQA